MSQFVRWDVVEGEGCVANVHWKWLVPTCRGAPAGQERLAKPRDDHQADPLLLGLSKKPRATFPARDQAEPRQRDGWMTQEGIPRLIHAVEAPFPEAEVSAAEEGSLVFPP